MTSTDYGQDILIDGLNVSNWDSPGVYESLRERKRYGHQRDHRDLA